MNRTRESLLRCALFALGLAAVVTGSCTNVVNVGTLVAPLPPVGDAATDPNRPAEAPPTAAEACTNSGGRIETRTCCGTTQDLSFFCWDGTCACPVGTPNPGTRQARLCICPMDECFYPTGIVMSSDARPMCARRIGPQPNRDASTAEASMGSSETGSTGAGEAGSAGRP